MPRQPVLLKISAEPGALPETGKVSEMIREFAEPLLYADPAGPDDLETVRTALMLAMICWNLPVYEALGSSLYTQGLRTLDAVERQVPGVIASTLRRLIQDRKTKFGAVPFLVSVEVKGTTLADATIVAEARMPRAPS